MAERAGRCFASWPDVPAVLPITSCPECGKKNRLPSVVEGAAMRCGACRADLLSQPLELSDATFEWLKGFPAAIVDFWAPWCGPCVQFAPSFAASAKSGSSVVHAKVNVDENPASARTFRVTGIPTMVLLRDGVEVDRIVGAVSAGALQSAVKRLAP